MNLWMTSNTFWGLLNYGGIKAQKHSLSRFSMGWMYSSSGPVLWLWSAFSKAQFVTRRRVKHSHPTCSGTRAVIPTQTLLSLDESCSTAGCRRKSCSNPISLQCVRQTYSPHLPRVLHQTAAWLWQNKISDFFKLIHVLVNRAQKGKKGDGVQLGDQSVLCIQCACL